MDCMSQSAVSISRSWRLWGAVALLVAGAQYLIAEAITAAAWKTPTYGYAYNFISDLGSPSCNTIMFGRELCSPAHAVMNTGFTLQAVLFIVAAGLLFRLVTTGWRYVLLALALVHGVGLILVGIYSETPEAMINGDINVHGFGALGTIVAGNVIAIVASFVSTGIRLPRWFRVAGVVLGIVGLAAFVTLQAMGGGTAPNGGIPERIAVYTIIAWEMLLGVLLLANLRTSTSDKSGRLSTAKV
jgi:hypothetical membrane protein